MFTLAKEREADGALTFHFDAEGETPRRFHATNAQNGRFVFSTDMCRSKERQPGIPSALEGQSFADRDETVAAVLALN